MTTIPPKASDRLRIEPERPGDARAISAMTTAAFAPMPFSDGDEASVIDDLRQAGALTLSLVAITARDELVGHIAFSPVQIDGQPGDWCGLGPVCAAPGRQRQGVGSALITAGLDRLRDLGASGCVLLGNPDYYRRFGFLSGPTLTYHGQPNPLLPAPGPGGPTRHGRRQLPSSLRCAVRIGDPMSGRCKQTLPRSPETRRSAGSGRVDCRGSN